MMQQLSFSPVENILTVLFAAAILGYLLYLLVRSLRNRQRGYHTVNRAKVFSKRQATAVNQPVYLANGTVNSGVTEAENVKTVILKIWKRGRTDHLGSFRQNLRRIAGRRLRKPKLRDGKLVSFGALQNRDDRERSFRG